LSHLITCTPTKSILYLVNFLAAAVSEPAQYKLLTFQVPNKIFLFFSCCVILPLETLPVRDPSGEVVYLRIVLSPEEASHLMSIS
jgi:hypothetical protein